MTKQNIRRLAMQVLFQIDQSLETDPNALFDAQDADHDPVNVRKRAIDLALGAWKQRNTVDRMVGQIAPDWPAHRQPPVDRAILRLAHYEMVTGHAPVKVAINEAVELAKKFGSENSPAFINGVLDKVAKRVTPPESPQSASASDQSVEAFLESSHEPPPLPETPSA